MNSILMESVDDTELYCVNPNQVLNMSSGHVEDNIVIDGEGFFPYEDLAMHELDEYLHGDSVDGEGFPYEDLAMHELDEYLQDENPSVKVEPHAQPKRKPKHVDDKEKEAQKKEKNRMKARRNRKRSKLQKEQMMAELEALQRENAWLKKLIKKLQDQQ